MTHTHLRIVNEGDCVIWRAIAFRGNLLAHFFDVGIFHPDGLVCETLVVQGISDEGGTLIGSIHTISTNICNMPSFPGVERPSAARELGRYVI